MRIAAAKRDDSYRNLSIVGVAPCGPSRDGGSDNATETRPDVEAEGSRGVFAKIGPSAA